MPRLARCPALVVVVCLACYAAPSCVPAPAATVVNVELDEFTIVSNPSAAPAGTITFSVANVGDEGHEFRIIKTDLSPDAIPTEVDGSYAEHGPGTEIIDEIGFIPPGGEAQLTVDLEAGAYVLICNFIDVDGGHVEAHYMEGMRDGFTVD